jgi:hypothetical protein
MILALGLMAPLPASALAGRTSHHHIANQSTLEGVLSHLDALHQATGEGTAGVRAPVPRLPLRGWSGERVVSNRYDDWEPAIAADPNAPDLYRLVTRFGHPACARHCPDSAIVLQVSRTNGRRWGPSRYLCRCKGAKWQADPQIEVAAKSGIVEAAFLNGYNAWFSRSLDHGRTWSKAKSVIGHVAWADKPILATSANGRDVYIAFNGPTHGDAFVAVSHDGGATWKQPKAITSNRYTYAFGGYVLSNGRVVFSETSLQYENDGKHLRGADRVLVLRSIDRGATWTKKLVATLQLGRICTSKGCPPDFYDGHTALAADGGGRLLLLADGAVRRRGIRRVFAWLSLDAGVTWSPRVQLSLNSANAGFPAAVGTESGQFRVWFMDRRRGRWNTLYRTSFDGLHWSPAARLSNATGGVSYIAPAGFGEVYGDYGEIDVTNTGKSVAIWGEGPSYAGPGGCWFNRQT